MTGAGNFASAFSAAFLASAVEAVEAATVVIAAGVTRGWNTSLLGAGAGAAVLTAVVALLGPALAQVPIAILQVTTGTFLLLFGVRWLRKSILRYAGALPMRDEAAIFERERRNFGDAARPRASIDVLTGLAVFKVVLLEGAEVIVIVLGIGAAGNLLPAASAGALTACLAVALAAVILSRPLARVPENALKLAVGVMVSAFGIFWFGEGVGIQWPHGDVAIFGLIALFLAMAAAAVPMARR